MRHAAPSISLRRACFAAFRRLRRGATASTYCFWCLGQHGGRAPTDRQPQTELTSRTDRNAFNVPSAGQIPTPTICSLSSTESSLSSACCWAQRATSPPRSPRRRAYRPARARAACCRSCAGADRCRSPGAASSTDGQQPFQRAAAAHGVGHGGSGPEAGSKTKRKTPAGHFTQGLSPNLLSLGIAA